MTVEKEGNIEYSSAQVKSWLSTSNVGGCGCSLVTVPFKDMGVIRAFFKASTSFSEIVRSF